MNKKEKQELIELVQYIDSNYVSDSCVQLMFHYFNEGFCIIKNKEIVYIDEPYDYKHPELSKYQNDYLNDERRFNFPHNDVPMHIEYEPIKTIVVNQLLDYNAMYTVIRQCKDAVLTMYLKVLKDKDNALVIQSSNEDSEIFNMDIARLRQLAIPAEEPEFTYMSNKDKKVKVRQ